MLKHQEELVLASSFELVSSGARQGDSAAPLRWSACCTTAPSVLIVLSWR